MKLSVRRRPVAWLGASPGFASELRRPLGGRGARGELRSRGHGHPQVPSDLGGIESHVHEVAQRMSAAGHDITVLTIALDDRLPAAEPQGDVSSGGFRPFRNGPTSTSLRRWPGRSRRGGYDLVHMQGVHTLLAPMALAAPRGPAVPSVLTFHSGGNSSRLRTAIREMQWQAQRPCSAVRCARSPCAGTRWTSSAGGSGSPPETIRLIRNGAGPLIVDEDSVPTVSGTPLICSVGRLERYKGHQRVIAAMPALLDLAPEPHLAVVGSWPVRAASP